MALSLTAILPFGGMSRATEPVAAVATVAEDFVASVGRFESQGKSISVERFEPKAEGRRPAVVVVHGSGGMIVGGYATREAARRLAQRGYVVHVVHYFDLTGTIIADRPTMNKNFASWLRAVADAVTYISRQPNVDPDRIGLIGFSLGSFLSTTLGMYDERICAVVDYFGGLPDVLVKDVKTLPPTLILHGDADAIVPVSEARSLESVLKSRRIPHDLRIYGGQGHGFNPETFEDSARRTIAFFDTHVRGASSGRPRREIAPLPAPTTVNQLIEQAKAKK
jgi:dienelactone hydrolase